MSGPSGSNPPGPSDVFAATATWGFEDCDINQLESGEDVALQQEVTTQQPPSSTPATQGSNPPGPSDVFASTATWGFEDCDIDQPESGEDVALKQEVTSQQPPSSTLATQWPYDTPTTSMSPNSWAALSHRVLISPARQDQKLERAKSSTVSSASESATPVQSWDGPSPHEKVLPPLPAAPQPGKGISVVEREEYLGSRQE